MLQDVRADNQVELSQFTNIFFIDVDFNERCVRNLRKQRVVLVRKCDLASSFFQFCTENAMSATKVQRSRFPVQLYATMLDPFDRVLRLQEIEGEIIFIFEMMGNQFMDDHPWSVDLNEAQISRAFTCPPTTRK